MWRLLFIDPVLHEERSGYFDDSKGRLTKWYKMQRGYTNEIIIELTVYVKYKEYS